MKQSFAKTRRVFQENTLVIANTVFQQHKRRLYTWTSPNGQYRTQTDYIFCSFRWRSSLQLSKTRLAADCGSDHELLIPTFKLKLKNIEETTRPFRYNLNQIPYDYTEEVKKKEKETKKKGLDLIDRISNGLWTEDYNTVQEVVIKIIVKKKKFKKANGCLRRPYK